MLLLGVVIVIFCLLLGWVANVARTRGRNLIGWAAFAGFAGIAGVIAALATVARWTSDSYDLSELPILFALVLPVAFMVAPMVAIGLVVMREPVKVARRKQWPVHVMGRGTGTITFTGDTASFAWPDASITVPLSALTNVAADGECVRVGCTVDGADQELVLLPMGNPDTRDGRIAQSRMLARRLREPAP